MLPISILKLIIARVTVNLQQEIISVTAVPAMVNTTAADCRYVLTAVANCY
jgi:hypothetical protein